MTVCAPHLALLNLGLHQLPRDGSVHKGAHICSLVPYVVEVQHIRIGFAAVDAGMLEQIVANA